MILAFIKNTVSGFEPGGTAPGKKLFIECRVCNGKGYKKAQGHILYETTCGACKGTGKKQIK